MERLKQGPIGIIGSVLVAFDLLRLVLEWRVIRTALEMSNLGQAVDFALEHWEHPGWVANPSIQFLVLLVGLGLIFWDRKRPSWLPSPELSSRQMIIGGLIVIVLGVAMVGYGYWSQARPFTIGVSAIGGPDKLSDAREAALAWDDHLGHTYSGVPGALVTQAIQISAKNTSDNDLTLEDAFVNSEISGEKITLKIAQGPNWVVPTSADPITPGKLVTFRVEFNPPTGIPSQDFYSEWRSIRLTVKYDGALHHKIIDEKMVAAIFTSFRPNPLDLPVTPKVAASPAVANSPAPAPKRHYDAKEIGEMLAALRALDTVIDGKYEPAVLALSDLISRWDARVRADLTNNKIDEIQKVRDRLVGAREEILQILKNNSFYRSELEAIWTGENRANSSMESALDQFIKDVRELLKHPGVDLPKFAHPALNHLESVNGEMREWIPKVKAVIQQKTAELRDWKNP